MSITIDGDTWGAAAMTAGRYEVAWMPSAPEHQETELHVPGVEGSYTSSGGFVGQDISCALRWIGETRGGVWDTVNEDIASWAPVTGKRVISITGPGGETFSRCKLKTVRTIREIPVGDGTGYHVIDLECRFRAYAPSSLPA